MARNETLGTEEPVAAAGTQGTQPMKEKATTVRSKPKSVATAELKSAPKAPKEKGLERKTSWIELTYEDKELLKETGKLDKLYPNDDTN